MEGPSLETKKPLTRFGEFELLKAAAIIGLPAIHVMEEILEAGFASPALQTIGDAVIGLCAFGPSVFMICMGFGIGGSKSSPDSIRKTGIQFLLIGALLNIFRWFLPGVLQAIVIHTPLIEDVNFCLQSDIYYFAGIFFVVHSYFKKWKIQTPGLILFSLLGLTLNTLLTPLTNAYITNDIAASIVGNIVYVNETSCFPLLSWAIFPSTGILLGELLKKADEEKRENIMRRLMDFSLVLFIAFVVFLRDRDIDVMKTLVSPANDYITDLPNVVLLITLAGLFSRQPVTYANFGEQVRRPGGIVFYFPSDVGHIDPEDLVVLSGPRSPQFLHDIIIGQNLSVVISQKLHDPVLCQSQPDIPA